MARLSLETLLCGRTKFGRLTVIGDAADYVWVGASRTVRTRRVACACECGNTTDVDLSKLRSGQTVSCGCYGKVAAALANRTHGMTGSPEYMSWISMRSRCLDPNDPAYDRYAGRGITVCDGWATFEQFLADMGPRPPDTSLDRIDNDLGYEPGNCRWATRKQQARNRRGQRLLSVRGEQMSLAEACERFQINRGTVRGRLRSGWSVEQAVGLAKRG